MPTSPFLLRRVVHVATSFMLLAAGLLPAQTPRRRLSAVPGVTESRIALPGSVTLRSQRSEQLGALSGETQITSMSLVLKPSAEQEAALTTLLAQQNDPSSANYHQWLTPEQYGQRFGLADADLSILQTWLSARGFAVESVAPSRNRIVFSGTASAVQNAFQVSLRRYRRNGQAFFENSDAVQLPASLADVVSGVTGLSSYRLPAPQAKRALTAVAAPDYTTSTGKHYLVPWDLRQIYGTNTLLNAGYDGTGVKIGVIGQSAIDTTQLTYFQQKTGQTVKLPSLVLVPNTSSSAKVSGDEGESELDLEYASGNAPGASVVFIYTGCANATTGNCNNNGVFDALSYAITNNLVSILSLSYGGCEAADASYANVTLEPLLRQANIQGQTIVVSSGDSGAAGCESSSTPKVATGGLSVSYPASSPYVTAVGGTTLNTDSTTYWSSGNNSSLGSAVGYMPEIAWNDTAAYGSFTASGGGYSKIFGKPSWQSGNGVPADGHRDVPDVSFPANVTEHAYIVCSEDATCSSGSNGFTLTGTSREGGGVGGTSASAPSFAGMLAIVEQAMNASAQGNINPNLYALAAGTSGSTIFHDITSGNNIVSCTVGTADCTSGSFGYSAGTGYDQVTGLGSIDIPSLLTGLKSLASSSTTTATAVTLSASNTAPALNTAVTFTANVTATGGTPAGSVTFLVDGATTGTSVTLSSGIAQYTLSAGFSTTGSHTVTATYGGSSTYGSGSASITITAGSSSTSSGSISLSSSPSTLTISAGSSGTETITATSVGFAGALSFRAVLTSATTSTFPYCLSLTPVTLTANSSQNATLTVNTAANCATTGSIVVAPLARNERPSSGGGSGGLLAVAAGLLGCFALRRRRPAALLLVIASAAAFGLAGCGSGTSSSSSSSTTTSSTSNSTTTTGTYGLQITATSSTNTAISASTSFTLVVK